MLRRKAFEAQKAAYVLGTSSWIDPVCEVLVPHTHRKDQEESEIPVYIRLPTTALRQAPLPVTVVCTEAEQSRADYSWALHECLRKGRIGVILETPGSGDSPAEAQDAESLARLWESLVTWLETQGIFDLDRLTVWWPEARDAGCLEAVSCNHGSASWWTGDSDC